MPNAPQVEPQGTAPQHPSCSAQQTEWVAGLGHNVPRIIAGAYNKFGPQGAALVSLSLAVHRAFTNLLQERGSLGDGVEGAPSQPLNDDEKRVLEAAFQGATDFLLKNHMTTLLDRASTKDNAPPRPPAQPPSHTPAGLANSSIDSMSSASQQGHCGHASSALPSPCGQEDTLSRPSSSAGTNFYDPVGRPVCVLGFSRACILSSVQLYAVPKACTPSLGPTWCAPTLLQV